MVSGLAQVQILLLMNLLDPAFIQTLTLQVLRFCSLFHPFQGIVSVFANNLFNGGKGLFHGERSLWEGFGFSLED